MSSEPDFVANRLAEIRALGRFRRPPTIQDCSGVRGRVNGRDVHLFCSNDYLGLRSDPRLVAAGHAAARAGGSGSGSSRLIAGSLPIHRELEEALADWMGTPAALVCSSGYQANLALLQGLSRLGDQIFSDSLNHASIIDGCRLSRASVSVVPHGESTSLRRLLSQECEGQQFVVAEGLYSMDGDRAALALWASESAAAGAHLLVDEAHAVGVFGPQGRGVSSEAGVENACLARVGTFGKALGSHGAFVACGSGTRDLLVNTGRTYIFTTGLPPSSAGSALAALEIVRSDEGAELSGTLAARSRQLRSGLKNLDLAVLGDEDSPIVPVVVGEEHEAMSLYRSLLDEGVYAMAIRPPTVAPGTCRLRFTLSATHTIEMVDGVLAAMSRSLSQSR